MHLEPFAMATQLISLFLQFITPETINFLNFILNAFSQMIKNSLQTKIQVGNG